MAGFTDDSDWNIKMLNTTRIIPHLATIQEVSDDDMQDDSGVSKQDEDIKMDNPQSLTQLNHTLADLFQLLNDDELFKEGVGPFKAKKGLVRLYYESKLAKTGHQAQLSGTGESLQEPQSSWGLRKTLPEYNPRYPLESIRSNDGSIVDENKEFRDMISIYKNHYCWLSGIRITPPTPLPTNLEGRKKTGEKYLNFHPNNCDITQKKQNVNQDEHAISFFFMLIFMGGIASIPNNLYNEHYKSFFYLYSAAAAAPAAAESPPLWQQYISWKINNNLDIIQQSGVDPNLNTRTFPWSLHLLDLMGLKSSSQKAKFWQNKQKLNYWGIWPSFCYPNQWKSNFDMIRLGFKITKNNIRDPYFYPSSSLIKSFVDFSQAMVSNREDIARYEREKALPSKRKPNIVGITSETPDGQRVFYYSRTNKGLLPKFGDDLHSNDHSNDHFIRNWNSEIAKNNITQVLHMICYIANEFLIDRIFYNCVIVCYLFKYGARSAADDRISITTGRFAASDMRTRGRARTEMQQHNIGIPRDVVSSREIKSEEREAPNQYEINLFLQKKKNNIEKFIKSYIEWKKINIENEISKIESYMKSLNNSITQNAKDEQYNHKKNVMDHLKETKDLFDMLKEIKDGTFMKLDRLHHTITKAQLKKLRARQEREKKKRSKAKRYLEASRTKYDSQRRRFYSYIDPRTLKKISDQAKTAAKRQVTRDEIISERRKTLSKARTGTGKKKKKKTRQKKRKKNKKGGGKKKTKRRRRRKRTRKKKN